MTALDVIQRARDLPAASPAALRLLGLLGADSTDSGEVLACLKCDPALTARLLRLCNSPALGLREPVGSVDQALLLLGYQRLFELVLQAAFGNALGASLPPYCIEAKTLWRHSVVTAYAAELLAEARESEGVPTDLAFTVGLLHDVGKLLLAQVLDAEAGQAIRQQVQERGLARPEAERAVLGTDHAEVGAELLQRWGLPEVLVHGVREHHQPCSSYASPVCIVAHLANCLAHTLGADAGWEALANRVDAAAQARWALDSTQLEQLLLRLGSDLTRIEAFVQSV